MAIMQAFLMENRMHTDKRGFLCVYQELRTWYTHGLYRICGTMQLTGFPRREAADTFSLRVLIPARKNISLFNLLYLCQSV